MGYGPQQSQPSNSQAGGKGAPMAETQPIPEQPRPMGKGGAQTNSATSGQPTIGAPNQYSNTVGQWDNTQQQTQLPMQGKGKGA